MKLCPCTHISSSSISFLHPFLLQPLYNRRRDVGPTDEDLSHPLAGESIEVPGEEQYFNDTHAHVQHSRAHSIGHAPSYHSDSRSLPTAGAGLPPFRAVYNVKFKRTQRPFEIGPRLTRDLKVGTYVKVEADRGEDLGIVVGYVGKGLGVPQQRASFGGGMGDPPAAANSQMPHDRKKIIRLATHDEVALLQMKRDEEDELLRVCRMKVRQRGLLMNVVDAEYQFDRHKLTFFFEAEGRVDFRELVRDLFSIYKTRIWMQQLDKSISATCPAAPEPESLAMDYGTPILAPAHEYEDFATANVGAGDEDGFNGLHDHM
jgi:PSP1 C-terminal conserved region